MNGSSPGFTLVAVAALALACFGIYQASQKRSCECPRPLIHDGDEDRNEPRRPFRPRRPDGSTGSTGEVKTSELLKDTNGIVKRDN